MDTMRVCPYCKNDRFALLVDMEAEKLLRGSYGDFAKNADRRIGGIFPIVRCTECTFVYSRRLPDKSDTSMIYDRIIKPANDRDYVHSFEYLKAMTAIYHMLLFSLNDMEYKGRTLKILDYGAGWGQFLEVAKNPKNEVFGFETSDVKKDYMRGNGICVLEDEDAILRNAPYDIICCNQVIEHVPNPIEVLKLIHGILRKEGAAWVAVPHYPYEVLQKHIKQYNDFNEESKWDEYPFTLNPIEHLNYFSPEMFHKSIKAAGFYMMMIMNYMNIRSTPILWPDTETMQVTEGVLKKRE